jgi:hypothetical protein
MDWAYNNHVIHIEHHNNQLDIDKQMLEKNEKNNVYFDLLVDDKNLLQPVARH